MPLKNKEEILLEDSGVPLTLLRASEIQPYLRMCLVGPSGSGKTHLTATSAFVDDMSPVLLIDCGESSDTVLGEEQFAGKLDVVRVRNMDEMQAVFNWLAPSDKFKGGQNGAAAYKTIVIDESDELHLAAMRPLMKEAHQKNPSQNEFVASQREWGVVRMQMLEVVDWFRVLPVHLIFTYVPYVKINEITKQERVTIGLAGKLSDDLAKRFSLVVYLDLVEDVKMTGSKRTVTQIRKLYTSATGRILTKVRGESRATRLGPEIENPTMEEIYKGYFGV